MNNLLIILIPNEKKFQTKNILFIEPTKQGYGDLFFQTSLFSFLNNSGYKVSVLINKNHFHILHNNPNIENIFFWNLKNLLHIFRQEFIIVGLGKDTLKETFFMLTLYKSKKIILDRNIKLWKLVFRNNSNTIAWNVLVSKYLEITPKYPKPKIFFSKLEERNIKKHKSINKIGVICGVKNKGKAFEKIDNIINLISPTKKILLLGRGNYFYSGNRKVKNFINKISYRETLCKISSCAILIGVEGSLTQIASSLIPKTIILDVNKAFKKNCHPYFLKNTKIIDNKDTGILIQETLNQI